MRTARSWTAILAGTATVLALGLAPVTQATAAPDGDVPAGADDTREIDPGLRGKSFRIDKRSAASRRAIQGAKADPGEPAEVGDTRTWLGYDELSPNVVYLKRFVLRGIGDHVQVWVSNDRAFPTDDCRNDLGLTEVTQQQVNRFVDEFDDNMYPTESRAFSVPPTRNGSSPATNGLAEALDLPADYWKVGPGQNDDITVFVDNVRDMNYYDPQDEDGRTYIGGFFLDYFNEQFDRNIMTIDTFDWLHRTGANPPDDSEDPDYLDCADYLMREGLGKPDPRSYEGTFAHEYQHLLEYYEDTDEVSWVNEGISDWAQTLTGYVDPSVDPAADNPDGHLQCFAGYRETNFGGPENSLTQWGEQGAPETLCDYGATYSFMEYLASRYGPRIMTVLHRNNANGLTGLQNALDAVGAETTPLQLLHRWQAMVAIDKSLDRNGNDLNGGRAGVFSAESLRFHINWRNPEAYVDDGAPGNGSDYVRLRDESEAWLGADAIEEISFEGEPTALGEPVGWVVDATPPDGTAADDVCNAPPAAGTGAAALYSGCGDDLDRSIAREVTVPSGDPTLTFDSLWDTEELWDYAVIQVSDDDGETWSSLETEDTTTEHDPAADPAIVAELPGLNADSETWQTETADLSEWAGEEVLLSFRYMTDGSVAESGWWIRNIDVGGTAIPATLDGWQTQTQIAPDPVDDWNVQLVAYGDAGDPVWVHRMRLGGDDAATLSGDELAEAIGAEATTVAAIVSQDDPDEDGRFQAGYTLDVNGVTQPGGGLEN